MCPLGRTTLATAKSRRRNRTWVGAPAARLRPPCRSRASRGRRAAAWLVSAAPLQSVVGARALTRCVPTGRESFPVAPRSPVPVLRLVTRARSSRLARRVRVAHLPFRAPIRRGVFEKHNDMGHLRLPRACHVISTERTDRQTGHTRRHTHERQERAHSLTHSRTSDVAAASRQARARRRRASGRRPKRRRAARQREESASEREGSRRRASPASAHAAAAAAEGARRGGLVGGGGGQS